MFLLAGTHATSVSQKSAKLHLLPAHFRGPIHSIP